MVSKSAERQPSNLEIVTDVQGNQTVDQPGTVRRTTQREAVADGSRSPGSSDRGGTREGRDTEAMDILLVDDEAELRLSLAEALRDAGHRVTMASDGVEARGHVLARVFDVVICDVRLPQLDGLTLFRRLRVESPTTDVILITAFGE